MVLGEGHPDYADSLETLAWLYREIGDYAAAEPLFRQAMEIRRAALGEGHPDYADSLNNLAVVHLRDGRPRGGRASLPPGHGDPSPGAGRAPPRLRRKA